MSVILYKNGEPYKIEPEFLQAHLDMGYSLEREPKSAEQISDTKANKVKTEEAPESLEDMSEEDVRAKAKELGIKAVHRFKIENLKPKIEEVLNGGIKNQG